LESGELSSGGQPEVFADTRATQSTIDTVLDSNPIAV